MERDNMTVLVRRRLQKKWLTLAATALTLLFLVLGIVFLAKRHAEKKAIEEAGHQDDHTAVLSFVGDITIDDALIEDALQPDGTYDFLPCFLDVAERLYQPDLTIGNLELNFGGEPYGSTYDSAPPAMAETLNLLGFDILQTANSKAISSGISGLEATLDVIRDNGMDPLGTYTSRTDHDDNQVLVKTVNGLKIAFIAFTKGFDGRALPAGREYVSNVLYTDYDSMYSKVNTSGILSTIQAAKDAEADIIIAMVHWGSSYKLALSDTQTSIMNILMQNGVDVVIGNHSHVVGQMGFETVTIDNRPKDVFVATSLGNFYSSDSSNYTRNGVILNLTISKDDVRNETIVSAVNYTPIYLWDSGEKIPDRYRVLDLYKALEVYKTSYYTRITDIGFGKLETAVADLAKNSGSLYDPIGVSLGLVEPRSDDEE